MTSVTRIDLLRHGQTTAGDCFIGSSDVDLTQQGWQQMQQALAEKSLYDVVITSPLRRCSEFAQWYGEKNKIPVIMENDLREMSFGAWEMQSSEQLWQTDRQRLSLFWDDPVKNSPPGGEQVSTFYHRVIQTIERICKDYQQQHVLLVAHGGSIKSIIAWALNRELHALLSLNVGHGSVTGLQVDGDGGVIIQNFCL